MSDPDLYRLLTFLVPNLMSLFNCLGRTKGSVQARGNCICFYGEELLAPLPTPKQEDHPLSVVRDSLFNTFVATVCIGRLGLAHKHSLLQLIWRTINH